MSSLLTDLPIYEMMKEVFNNAGPILIGSETLKSSSHFKIDFIKEKKWLSIWETTRILLAHAVLTSNKIIISTMSENIRNLYRLYGLDLADAEKWSGLTTCNHFYYIEPNKDGIIWIPKSPEETITHLKSVSFDEIQKEFENDDDTMTKILIGNSIYSLVATKYGPWKSAMKKYKLN